MTCTDVTENQIRINEYKLHGIQYSEESNLQSIGTETNINYYIPFASFKKENEI